MSGEDKAKNPWRGVVKSLSRDGKTAKVAVPTQVKHNLYLKRLRRDISLHVDTNGQPVVLGAAVEILPCRRISKTKSWKVVGVRSQEGSVP